MVKLTQLEERGKRPLLSQQLRVSPVQWLCLEAGPYHATYYALTQLTPEVTKVNTAQVPTDSDSNNCHCDERFWYYCIVNAKCESALLPGVSDK